MGFQLPTSTGEFTGFLNHQQYGTILGVPSSNIVHFKDNTQKFTQKEEHAFWKQIVFLYNPVGLNVNIFHATCLVMCLLVCFHFILMRVLLARATPTNPIGWQEKNWFLFGTKQWVRNLLTSVFFQTGHNMTSIWYDTSNHNANS